MDCCGCNVFSNLCLPDIHDKYKYLSVTDFESALESSCFSESVRDSSCDNSLVVGDFVVVYEQDGPLFLTSRRILCRLERINVFFPLDCDAEKFYVFRLVKRCSL